jgi:hypothetical protein
MTVAADIVSKEYFAAAAPVLSPIAGFDFECAGKHDEKLAPGGWVPILIEALGHLRPIVLCAGSIAERWTVLPKASVDASSIGRSTSINCDPPSDAEAKRTIFMRALPVSRHSVPA